MKEGRYEEINYGDERVFLNKKEGRIEHRQGRSEQQYEDSARSVGYALLAFMVIGLISCLVMVMS